MQPPMTWTVENRKRFSGKSDIYSKYRPGYPDEIIALLQQEIGLTGDYIIADIGSGTGLLARTFLENGNLVHCVEPNDDMRSKCMESLSSFPNCIIHAGSAEDTGLGDGSVDLAVVGQAFHWFDQDLAKKEFSRILKPGRKVALVWNDRVHSSEGLMREYEEICSSYSNGYHKSGSGSVNEDSLGRFFNRKYSIYKLPNTQKLDLEGLKGRYFSASYAIDISDSRYKELIERFERVFRTYQKGGHVYLEYETIIFIGSV